MTLFLILAYSFHQKLGFSLSFNEFLAQISHAFSKLDADSVLIFGSKSSFGDDLGQSDTKTHYFMSLFGQTLLRNRVTMAAPKVPGDQILFERVCYMLIRKVTKPPVPTPNSF